MHNQFTDAINNMAAYVAQYQNCVLELLISDNTAAAHLIPLDEWRAENEEDDE